MIGVNSGGQLNIVILEVVCVTTINLGATIWEIPNTISVHPLLTDPSSIRYTDNTRSAVMQTTGGSIRTVGGRALRTVQLEGQWGVETRGLGPYLGTGEVRRERFYNEVVRMSDALTAGDVQACVSILTGTPFISLLVKPFIEGASLIGINAYDFYNDRSFQVQIKNYTDTRAAKNGGASGNIGYSMTIEEVGPLITGSLGSTIINGLMTVLGVWDDINEVLKTYTVTNIVDSFVGVAAIALSQVAESAAAVAGQVAAVQELMGAAGGSTSLRTSSAAGGGVAAFFQAVNQLVNDSGVATSALTQQLGAGETDSDTGAFDPATAVGEGENRSFAIYDALHATEQLQDLAAFYLTAGAFYGMGRDEYRNFIESGGATTGPSTAGSTTYTVSSIDTVASLELRFGVSWTVILETNGLTPDEALFPGTTLYMPVTRPRGPQGIRGLPTFGSHVGRAAWGADWPLEMTATDGVLDTVDDEDILEQGATFLIEQYSDDILQASRFVPDAVVGKYMAKRYSALLLTDQRFATVEEITVDLSGGAAMVNATVRAINGGTITTGAPR